MTKHQFKRVMNLLGHNNRSIGELLGFAHTKNQCRQVENILNGVTPIKPTIELALECLARRDGKLAEFEKMLGREIKS